MTSGPTCRCLLCRIEAQLAGELASSTAVYDAIRGSTTNGLRAFASPFYLLSHLKATQAVSSSDDLFRELLAARAFEPQFVETLMIVAFVPVLHGTVRRVLVRQRWLAEEDVVQQALAIFLRFIASNELQARQSHFAFAISRGVKRALFAWASHEGRKLALLESGGEVFPALATDEPFERYAQLRHFLYRCVTRQHLTPDELRLLIQFKLEGKNALHPSNGNASNAKRQRLKRLLTKLRRLAG